MEDDKIYEVLITTVKNQRLKYLEGKTKRAVKTRSGYYRILPGNMIYLSKNEIEIICEVDKNQYLK